MNPLKVRDYILDSSRNLQERLYVILSMLMIVFWSVTLIESVALGEKITKRLAAPVKREYDLRDYDWDMVAKKTVEVYREVLGK